jgi:rubrerythrin
MSIRYSADEVFEMAEQIERNGAKFYRRAAELALEESTRSLMSELADMEDSHERTFSGMRGDLSADERKEMVFDPDNELDLYLRTMADKHVFDVSVDPSERLTGGEKLEDILQMAIGLEKDSIVFYLGLKQMVPERFGRDRLDGIIREEYGHISTLAAKLPAS